MNNLHRELAPISTAAWADLEAEARRTFELRVAARRVVDVVGPEGVRLAAVGTGHLRPLAESGGGVEARAYEAARVSSCASRSPCDARTATPSPAVRTTRTGSRSRTRPSCWRSPRTTRSWTASARPDRRPAPVLLQRPDLAARRRARVPRRGGQGAHRAAAGRGGGPLQPAAVRGRLHAGGRDVRPRLPDPRAPRADPGRGRPDHLGPGDRRRRPDDHPRRRLRAAPREDVSIGYLEHDAETVRLYFQESFTFVAATAEACVALTP